MPFGDYWNASWVYGWSSSWWRSKNEWGWIFPLNSVPFAIRVSFSLIPLSILTLDQQIWICLSGIRFDLIYTLSVLISYSSGGSGGSPETDSGTFAICLVTGIFWPARVGARGILCLSSPSLEIVSWSVLRRSSWVHIALLNKLAAFLRTWHSLDRNRHWHPGKIVLLESLIIVSSTKEFGQGGQS